VRLLLPPPLRRVHPPPRTSPSISCRVHKPVVNQVRLPHQVLLGKNQHLQARPDYRHGWGAEDTGDVNKSRLGRRLLLRLCGRCLFSSSSGGFCAPLSNRRLALHLRQKLFDSGGWATTTSSFPPPCPSRLRRPAQRARKAASPASKETSSSTHELETSVLDYLLQDGLPLGTWSP
jgi:hypothetical protein